MELNTLIEIIKKEFPEKAIDLSECLTLLNEVINDTMEAMNNKMSSAYSIRDFANSKKYMDLGMFINEYENKINEIIDKLEVEDTQIELESETDEETEKKIIPNYAEYTVDSRIEHTLYENFTHIRPASFKLNNYNEEVRTWQEMLIKTCEYLLKTNQEKMHSFCNIPSMNGKKNKYFTKNASELRKAAPISSDLFIETNMSGNSIRNLIIKILKEYGLKASDYKVYYRADYTALNKD